MSKCDICKTNFPNELVQPLVMASGTYKACPICALNKIRVEHDLPRFVFRKSENRKRLAAAIVFKRQKTKYGDEQLDKI